VPLLLEPFIVLALTVVPACAVLWHPREEMEQPPPPPPPPDATGAAPSPPTDLLFLTYDGNFALECDATVVHVLAAASCADPRDNGELEEEKGSSARIPSTPLSAAVLLDRTVLHPQGGGQPADTGLITSLDRPGFPYEFRVDQVSMERATGVVTHVGHFRPAASAASTKDDAAKAVPHFREGERVLVQVDEDSRRILSECHTAGHVVDAAMAHCQVHMPSLKAYHYLDGSYVEYKGAVPANDRDALLQRLQDAFQLLLEQDLATEIRVLNLTEADQVCNQDGSATVVMDVAPFVDPVSQMVRVVTVAGYSCPCGGTHVRSTVELKANRWRITGLRCKKNVVRVKYGYEAPPKTTTSEAGKEVER
jgi:Ser-tRNA(Ala) deacylase AlaX